MTRILFGLLGAVLFAGSAIAGPQYVDKTGHALSGYDVVAYHDLKAVPLGKIQPNAVPGKATITADYNGARWAFASEANRDKFKADPAKYVPQFDGHCAYGLVQGGKVPGNPHLWRIVDGRLYLNVARSVVGLWEKDIPKHITIANKNWKGLAAKPAATRKVPELDIAAAPTK